MATKININNVEILVPTKQDITTQVNEIIDETIIETHVETTYAGLVTLRNNSELIPNTMYRITDYETTTAEPDTISAGHVFDVIVLATSVNTLSKDAWARKSVRDVENYFNEQDISLWKLEYDLDNYDTKFSWADTINGKGVIYRMIDELNNDLPYDFKNIKKYLSQSDFLELGGSIVNKNTDNYYYTFNTSKDTEGTTHGSSNTDIVNNFVKSYKHKEIYFLSVNLFINIGHVRNNNFFGESYDNVFVNSTVENNNITATFNTNRVKGLFTNNTINAAFQANKNISNFQYNIIDANFTKNDNVGRNFNYNHIVAGEAFNQNVLVGQNIIKNVFSSVSRTTINTSVQNNTLTNLYYVNVPEYTENVVASNLSGSSSSQFYLDFVGTDLDEFTDQGFPRTYNKINTEYYLTFVKDGILKSYKKDNFDDMSWTDITQSGGGIDLDEMAYFDYAGSIYGDKYSLLANAWEHSLTVDPLEIERNSTVSTQYGKLQYPNGEDNGVIIPDGVASIGGYAFYGWTSNNQPLVIPNSVTSIGGNAFRDWSSNNQPLTIPNSVTSIGAAAFGNWTSNNHPLVIPNSVTSIGAYAFRNWTSNNQPLVIPNSVTSIGGYVFYGWTSNNHPLVIPNSVTSIDAYAFSDWSNVPYIIMEREVPPTVARSSFNNQNNAPIYVPDGSVDDYKTATGWVDLADRIFPISEKDKTIEDAPSDSKLYGRKNEAWEEIPEVPQEMTQHTLDTLYYERLYGLGYTLEPSDWVEDNGVVKYVGSDSKIIVPLKAKGFEFQIDTVTPVTHVAEPIGFLTKIERPYVQLNTDVVDLSEINGINLKTLDSPFSQNDFDNNIGVWDFKLPYNIQNVDNISFLFYNVLTQRESSSNVTNFETALNQLNQNNSIESGWGMYTGINFNDLSLMVVKHLPNMHGLSNADGMFSNTNIDMGNARFFPPNMLGNHLNSLYGMFENATIHKNTLNNLLTNMETKNVVQFNGMFRGAQFVGYTDGLLDLSKWSNDSSRSLIGSIQQYEEMFLNVTGITTVDLSNFKDIRPTPGKPSIFKGSTIELVYVGDETTKETFENQGFKPAGIQFVVRPSEKSAVIEALDWNN